MLSTSCCRKSYLYIAAKTVYYRRKARIPILCKNRSKNSSSTVMLIISHLLTIKKAAFMFLQHYLLHISVHKLVWNWISMHNFVHLFYTVHPSVRLSFRHMGRSVETAEDKIMQFSPHGNLIALQKFCRKF